MVKGVPSRPMRCCRNRPGPGEEARASSQPTASSGPARLRPPSVSAMSSTRVADAVVPAIGVPLTGAMAAGAGEVGWPAWRGTAGADSLTSRNITDLAIGARGGDLGERVADDVHLVRRHVRE